MIFFIIILDSIKLIILPESSKKRRRIYPYWPTETVIYRSEETYVNTLICINKDKVPNFLATLMIGNHIGWVEIMSTECEWLVDEYNMDWSEI